MSFSIKERLENDIVVLVAAGRLTLGEGTITFRECIKRVVNEGHQKVVLNLKEVSYVDSTGIGELHGAFVLFVNMGAQLIFCNLVKRVHDLMQITKLYTVFHICDDESIALRSFGYAPRKRKVCL